MNTIDFQECALELLQAALYAFNTIPNRRLSDEHFKSTYELAEAINKFLEEAT